MLNFRQLHYFWTVATAGGVSRAAERLHLTPQTISGQLAELERSLGTPLFRRSGRRMELTAAGKVAFAHAEEIFQIGRELEATLSHRQDGSDLPFRVGVAEVFPKSIARHLLEPALALPDPVRLICRTDKLERLFAELAIHQLDLVVADRPLPQKFGVKGFSHALGRSALVLLAAPRLAVRYRTGFPDSLSQASWLMPGAGSAMRSALDRWISEQRITPQIAGEFDDTALMKAFGQAGAGVLAVPAVIAAEVRLQYELEPIGRLPVEITYYAISLERRLTHPAVIAISQVARRDLFSETKG